MRQYELAGITVATVKAFVLEEMAIAEDWDTQSLLLCMVYSIDDPSIKADALNHLLVMPGHSQHQAVTFEIQKLKSPTSIPYIRTVLESGFDFLSYTCSDDGVIAKWFSHALASIGTPEAIDLIKLYAKSGNAEVAEEMAYRLEKIEP